MTPFLCVMAYCADPTQEASGAIRLAAPKRRAALLLRPTEMRTVGADGILHYKMQLVPDRTAIKPFLDKSGFTKTRE